MVPDVALRRRLTDEIPRVPRAFYDAALMMPSGWRDRPAAYVQLSPAYDAEARAAWHLAWPVETLNGRHLDTATQPVVVADAVQRACSALGIG
jgi:hypothetical protein